MVHSRSSGSKAVTTGSTEVSEFAGLVTEIFCACADETRIKIGTMAYELFRRVDLEGQHLETAAEALGLAPGDAAAILAVVRGHVARNLVDTISARTIPDGRG